MIEFKSEEVLISVYRSKDQPKAGGMCFGGHEDGIVVTHLPTGLSSSCEEHRSQHRNKAIAIEGLSRKVQDYYVENGCPSEGKQGRFFVEDMTCELLEDYDYIILDSESFDEPIAAFLNKEQAEQYCIWMNENYNGGL